MSKQTAVSQIFAKIKAARKDTKFWNDSMLVDWLLEQEERYKQMEKEQIVDAIFFGMQKGLNVNKVPETDNDWVNNYYNETYGEKFGEKFGGQDEN